MSHSKLTDQERTELLDWVSACQSAYHIDSTPGHRFGGLPSNLQENRDELVEHVESLIEARLAARTQSHAVSTKALRTAVDAIDAHLGNNCSGEPPRVYMALVSQVLKLMLADPALPIMPTSETEPLKLHVIRKWPDGFADELEKVWLDLVGYIPNVKMHDLQRLLSKWGFTMQVYEGSASASVQPLTGVPEIDYNALIKAAEAKDKAWRQGSPGCVAFAKGAEYFREQAIAAAQAKGGA